MYCDRGGTDKNQPGQNPGQKPPRTIEIEFVQGTFVQDLCTRPTKNRGQRCVTFFRGVPGGGAKIGQNQRDVLHGRPQEEFFCFGEEKGYIPYVYISDFRPRETGKRYTK